MSVELLVNIASTSVEPWCAYFVFNGADFRDDTPWSFCPVQFDGIVGVKVFNCALVVVDALVFSCVLVGEFTLVLLLVLAVFRTHVLPFW